MNGVKAIAGIIGTVVIAGWVAYAVSAPRNFENTMNQDMAVLDGKSINEVAQESRREALAMQCDEFRRLADKEWDRAIEQGREPDMAEYDAQIARACQ